MRGGYLLVTGVLAAGCTLAPIFAQATDPPPREYPEHTTLGDVTIGADNLGHTLTTPAAAVFVPEFLVIEVNLAAPKHRDVTLSSGHFTLRINGEKIPLTAQPAGSVAASVKYPDWNDKAHVEGSVGMGDGDVVFGRQRPVGRFPGDNRGDDPTPRPKAPAPDNPAGVARNKVPIEQVFSEAALPEGNVRTPVTGFLFFEYGGKKKLKSIKTMELIYDGPLGKASLRLP